MIFSPFLGGILISQYSFQFTFLIVFSLLVISSIPIFKSNTKKIKGSINIKNAIKGFDWKLNFTYFIEGFSNMVKLKVNCTENQ